ncbi:MAG: prolipoprotein diacylglyceryl transferase [Clostridiales bacterium]|jgi:phosphatidylglycerol:prolipoprotein diacylglycerol transferase|nr:prolipoprotein diacylglyceryl transferase [Clostridiales bacterium]
MDDIMGAPDIAFPNIGLRIGQVDPVAFSLFGVDIRWYGIFIALGMLAGLIVASRQFRRVGENADNLYDFIFFAMLGALVFARLYYVAFSWEAFAGDPLSILNIRQGGLAIYGGIIGGALCAIVYCRARKLDFWRFADMCAPGIAVGQAIGRWGNFFNREAFGGYTNGFTAMMLKTSQVNALYINEETAANIVSRNGALYILVHPTFLYESLWDFAVAAALVLWLKRRKFDGELFALYLTLYALGRVWIEGLRTDQLLFPGTRVAVSQALSAALIVGGIVFIIFRRLKSVKRLTND